MDSIPEKFWCAEGSCGVCDYWRKVKREKHH